MVIHRRGNGECGRHPSPVAFESVPNLPVGRGAAPYVMTRSHPAATTYPSPSIPRIQYATPNPR